MDNSYIEYGAAIGVCVLVIKELLSFLKALINKDSGDRRRSYDADIAEIKNGIDNIEKGLSGMHQDISMLYTRTENANIRIAEIRKELNLRRKAGDSNACEDE